MNYKTLIMIIIINCILIVKSFSQDPITFICDFENQIELNIIVDSTVAGNLWQITQPKKLFFTRANSLPNAIVTDSIEPYPTNNISIFKFKSFNTEKSSNRCDSTQWRAMSLAFYHKFDTEQKHSGGYVEISYDGGVTWNNSIKDVNPNLLFIDTTCWYKETDTTTGGIPCFNGTTGFTGWTSGYQRSTFTWFWQLEPYLWDDIWLRFVFISDSLTNTSHEGWIVDDIMLDFSDYYNGIGELTKFVTTLYPMPLISTSIITIDKKMQTPFSMSIYDISGKAVSNEKNINGYAIKINRYYFNPGLYFYRITDKNNNIVTNKFIVK